MTRGWHYIPNPLYRVPFFYLFLACVFCYCSFLFVVFVLLFVVLFLSFVDVPPIFFCPADHVPDFGNHVFVLLLGMVEARSVNVKKTTTSKSSCLQ